MGVFDMLDQDRDGTISQEDLLKVFGKGESKDVWKKQLPEEFAHIAASIGQSAPHSGFSKEELGKLLGQEMRTSTGDMLSSVTAADFMNERLMLRREVSELPDFVP